jgi:hypothetical protein
MRRFVWTECFQKTWHCNTSERSQIEENFLDIWYLWGQESRERRSNCDMIYNIFQHIRNRSFSSWHIPLFPFLMYSGNLGYPVGHWSEIISLSVPTLAQEKSWDAPFFFHFQPSLLGSTGHSRPSCHHLPHPLLLSRGPNLPESFHVMLSWDPSACFSQAQKIRLGLCSSIPIPRQEKWCHLCHLIKYHSLPTLNPLPKTLPKRISHTFHSFGAPTPAHCTGYIKIRVPPNR